MYELPFKKENIPFKRFATKVDCSHNAVWNIPSLKKWIDITSSLGFNTLLLYMEDTYEIDGHPYFGYGRGRYSKKELKEINTYSLEQGIELIPSIATLAHLPTIFRWPQYAAINDTYDILLCDDERTYELIDAMFSTCAECFTSRVIDIHMDAEELLGRGKYLSQHGYQEREAVFQRHLERVRQIATKHGFTSLLISGEDGYRSITEEEHWSTVDVSVRNAFNPENHYSIGILKNTIRSAIQNGTQNMTVCLFCDDGGECARFAGIPTLFYASEIAKGNTNDSLIKERFNQVFDISFDDFLLLDLTQRNETEESCVHPTRYILYNDPFIGLMDKTIPDHTRSDHEELVKLLTPLCDHPEWGYMFRTLRELCAVTAKKCDVGMRIHDAYDAADKIALSALAEELRSIRTLVESFYKSFRKQWMWENKGHGFDVSDVRIGGVMMRLEHCARRLEEYASGDLERIAELEDEQLDVRTPLSPDYGKRKYMNYRDRNAQMYCDTVSANVLFKHRR